MDQIEESKEEDVQSPHRKHEEATHQQAPPEEDEDAFFDELDKEQIDEGVSTSIHQTQDKIK